MCGQKRCHSPSTPSKKGTPEKTIKHVSHQGRSIGSNHNVSCVSPSSTWYFSDVTQRGSLSSSLSSFPLHLMLTQVFPLHSVLIFLFPLLPTSFFIEFSSPPSSLRPSSRLRRIPSHSPDSCSIAPIILPEHHNKDSERSLLGSVGSDVAVAYRCHRRNGPVQRRDPQHKSEGAWILFLPSFCLGTLEICTKEFHKSACF